MVANVFAGAELGQQLVEFVVAVAEMKIKCSALFLVEDN